MNCPHCGGVVDDDAKFCTHCGEQLSTEDSEPTNIDEESANDTDTAVEWNPRYPIASVFSSIMLIWTAAAYDNAAFVILGIAIIPRVRLYLVRWVRDAAGVDLTTRTAVTGVGIVYGLLIGLAMILMGGFAARDPGLAATPLRWMGVWLGMLFIAAGIAVAIVVVARLIYKTNPGLLPELQEPSSNSVQASVGDDREGQDKADNHQAQDPTSDDSQADSSETEVDVNWWRGVQVFGGAAIFLFGAGITIQSPLGIPILLAGLALIPRVRHWSMAKLGKPNSD